jgi:serine/threonine-protein kinase
VQLVPQETTDVAEGLVTAVTPAGFLRPGDSVTVTYATAPATQQPAASSSAVAQVVVAPAATTTHADAGSVESAAAPGPVAPAPGGAEPASGGTAVGPGGAVPAPVGSPAGAQKSPKTKGDKGEKSSPADAGPGKPGPAHSR